MGDFLSNGLAVRVEGGPWGRVLDVDGLGTRRVVSFEREVAWMRVTHARVNVVDADGVEVAGCWGFDDSDDGFLSCLPRAVEAARAVAESRGLGPGHEASVRVRLLAQDLPCVRLGPAQGVPRGAPARYQHVPNGWIYPADHAFVGTWLDKGAVGEPIGTFLPVNCVGAVTVLKDVVAWSSANSERENEELMAAVGHAALDKDDTRRAA